MSDEVFWTVFFYGICIGSFFGAAVLCLAAGKLVALVQGR